MNNRKIKAFAEFNLNDYLSQKKQRVLSSIASEQEDYLLNINEIDYISHLTLNSEIELLTILPEKKSATPSHRIIPSEQVPSCFFVEPGKKFRQETFNIHIPYLC